MARAPDVPAACPACGSGRVAGILYGLPEFTPALERDLDEGRVVLGGCVVFEGSPRWACRDCRHEWGKVDRPPLADAPA